MSPRAKNWLMFAAGFAVTYVWLAKKANAAPAAQHVAQTTATEGAASAGPTAFSTSAGAASSADSYDAMTFSQAFAAARSAGLDTFTWRGALYTTQLAP